jgi:hypothetical protein
MISSNAILNRIQSVVVKEFFRFPLAIEESLHGDRPTIGKRTRRSKAGAYYCSPSKRLVRDLGVGVERVRT